MPPIPPGLQDAAGQVGTAVFVLALIGFYFIRENKRTNTELDATTDKAAIALIQENRQERAEMRSEMNGLRERIVKLEQERRTWADVLQVHAAWDFKVVESLRALDPSLHLGDVPPLYPAHPDPDFPHPLRGPNA